MAKAGGNGKDAWLRVPKAIHKRIADVIGKGDYWMRLGVSNTPGSFAEAIEAYIAIAEKKPEAP